MNPNSSSIDVSVVVIGRNEGSRLTRCLQSVAQANWGRMRHELIYVDSRSTDASVAAAQALGAKVMVLDDASPCAAKARNLGWQAASGDLVLFLDGDTELHPEFVLHAVQTLQAPDTSHHLCAVWGHRRESRPEQSLYTRLLDLDWVYPAGCTLYFGGDVLVRRAALVQVGGFDATLKAGEEPELCARLRAAHWEIEHIDAPMTQHDLAVNTLRAYCLRAYRSGIAYAEVAERMRLRGDVLWQHEARRDFWHGCLFVAAPPLLLVATVLSPVLALGILALALTMVVRTARRCAWKAPGQPLLCLLYAVHVHAQKIPALWGQLAWRRAARAKAELDLVDYKQDAGSAVPATHQTSSAKALLALALQPLAWCQRQLLGRWARLWSHARLQEALGHPVHASNVILGAIELHGTCNIRLGKNALIYPGVYLETQGNGAITLGDGVVLSRGVHIVAFDAVVLGDGCMVGEYSSIRDANHRLHTDSVRHSGHDSAAIQIGRNVWLGRGVSVLMGASLGDNAVVAANAVVNRYVPAGQVVGGVPAKPLRKPSVQPATQTTGAMQLALHTAH